MEKIKVVAPQGKICAKELSKEKITDAVPVLVPYNSFYRRLVAEGSLLIYKEEAGEKKNVKKA